MITPNIKVDPQYFVDNADKYIIVEYEVATATKTWDQIAEYICFGQSIGNISIRNEWETPEMIQDHGCKYYYKTDTTKYQPGLSQLLVVGFPAINFSPKFDGITQILCSIMGGQVDVDGIDRCRVLDIHLPDSIIKALHVPPAYGLYGLQQKAKITKGPLLGGIIKPKIGMTPKVLLEQVKQMVDNGINWIKEDEIMGDPQCCPLAERVSLVMDYINAHAPDVLYHANINTDPIFLKENVGIVKQAGGNGVHINLWAGLGAYRSIALMRTGMSIHIQKSMDKVFTHPKNPYSISWYAICKLVPFLGADSIHVGMIFGYGNDDSDEIVRCIDSLVTANVTPALSCGLGPHNIQKLIQAVGHTNFLANVGGCIQGHPGGTAAGTRAMRQALDGNHGADYDAAIKKWGN